MKKNDGMNIPYRNKFDLVIFKSLLVGIVRNYKNIAKGCLGCFGRNEIQCKFLGFINKRLLDHMVSENLNYIYFGICVK